MSKFDFKVFSNRWGHHNTYTLTKTPRGWHVRHSTINGDCGPDGKPFLRTNLDQDNIDYPDRFGGFLEFIWGKLHFEEIDSNEAQQKIQELADWISACERSQPRWREWNC